MKDIRKFECMSHTILIIDALNLLVFCLYFYQN